MIRRLLVLAALVPTLALAAPPRVAIIIDDLGYHRERGEAVLDLPASLTGAVIPHAPHAPYLAQQAIASGKEVMIHLPMATVGDRPLDKGALSTDMDADAVRATVRDALARIPQAAGLNNHMGSVLTTQPKMMQALMEELHRHQRYFIDSRTTPDSVAEDTARQLRMPVAGRDVFLDNERNLLSINEQFNQLLDIARRHGSAIAIGHPYPETISYLEKILPLLPEMGIEVVPVSRLLLRGDEEQTRLAQRPLPEEEESRVR